jgi:signal transduction histidine kinase
MKEVDERRRQLLVECQKHELNGVLIAVKDSGTGLDSESLSRVFDAFYTTQARWHGHGSGYQPLDHRGTRRAAVGNS